MINDGSRVIIHVLHTDADGVQPVKPPTSMGESPYILSPTAGVPWLTQTL